MAKTVFRPAFGCVQHPKLVEIHNICKYVIVCKQESWQKANAFNKVNKTNYSHKKPGLNINELGRF